MFTKTFAGHFTGVTDEREVKDPWGIGFSVTVLRAGHKEWERWQEENGSKSPMVEMFAKVGTKAMLARQLAASGGAEPRKGFRNRSKLSKAEREAMRATARVRGDAAAMQVLNDAIDGLSPEELAQGKVGTGYNDLKPGIALVLLRAWRNVTDDDGTALPCDLHHRLEFLGWDGFLVTMPPSHGGVQHFLPREKFEALDPESDEAKAIASGTAQVVEYKGNPRDAQGALIWVPAVRVVDFDEEEVPYGPGPVGDCLAAWLLDEAKDGDAFQARVVAETADVFTDTPSGASATSAG